MRTKSHIKIKVTIGDESVSFNLSPVGIIPKKYWVKRGRSRSEKMPMASLTQIFEELRKWVVLVEDKNRG